MKDSNQIINNFNNVSINNSITLENGNLSFYSNSNNKEEENVKLYKSVKKFKKTRCVEIGPIPDFNPKKEWSKILNFISTMKFDYTVIIEKASSKIHFWNLRKLSNISTYKKYEELIQNGDQFRITCQTAGIRKSKNIISDSELFFDAILYFANCESNEILTKSLQQKLNINDADMKDLLKRVPETLARKFGVLEFSLPPTTDGKNEEKCRKFVKKHIFKINEENVEFKIPKECIWIID